jgi:hypothetical protein
LPPVPGGTFAASLDTSIAAARRFHGMLSGNPHFVPLMEPELDIVVWMIKAQDTEAASLLARRIFALAAAQDLHLATIELPTEFVRPYAPDLDANTETVTCLRSVLMKPEHDAWLEPINRILDSAVKQAIGQA